MKTLHKNISIPALDGKETIAKSTMFAYIDSDFKNLGLNKVGEKTEGKLFEVLELDKDMTFKEMFTQPEKQWMTQAQVLAFIKEHGDKLRRDGWATLFLLKKDDEFFVTFVRVYSGGLRVGVSRFEGGGVWYAEYQRRLVSPQLDSEAISSSPLDTLTSSLDEAIKICKEAGLKIIRTKVIEEEL